MTTRTLAWMAVLVSLGACTRPTEDEPHAAAGGVGGTGASSGGQSDGAGGAGGQGGAACLECADDGCCASSCGYQDDLDCAACDGVTGMTEPMLVCSTERPCTHLLPLYESAGITEITTPSDVPVCATSAAAIADGRPAYDDGPTASWTDQDGVERHACRYVPPGTSALAPRPLLVFVHGSGGGAANVYDLTSLRTKAPSYDLTADAARPGFILVSLQGRNMHWPTEDPEDGSKQDTFHRDMSSNRDVSVLDDVIDELVAAGSVDPQRIYLSGWSNGARFAALYGIARHATATAGGNRVAAVANYSGGDPYENIRDGFMPSCKLATYPTVPVPFLLVSRTCDLVACDQAQADALASTIAPTPGNVAEVWVDALTNTVGADVTWRRITSAGVVATTCAPPGLCGQVTAALNHLRWPDGVADNSGNDHEPAMLDFLRDHPLP